MKDQNLTIYISNSKHESRSRW